MYIICINFTSASGHPNSQKITGHSNFVEGADQVMVRLARLQDQFLGPDFQKILGQT